MSCPALRGYPENEIYLSKLNEKLFGLRAKLWAEGLWEQGIDAEIASSFLPNLTAHLGLHASRIPRPKIPLPATICNREGEIVIIGDEDKKFSGWIRLAYIEEQYIRESDTLSPPPKAIAYASSGLIPIPLGRSFPSHASPLGNMNLSGILEVDAREYSHLNLLPEGYLGAVAIGKDWLRTLSFVVPSPSLIRNFPTLKKPDFNAPLIWTDEDNEPAISVRYWRVRGKQDWRGDQIDIEGSDLLIRPDLFSHLQSTLGMKILDVSRIHIQQLA